MAHEMQSTNRLLVARDTDTNEEALLVLFVNGSSGPTIANEMQSTNRLLVDRDPVTGEKRLLVKLVS